MKTIYFDGLHLNISIPEGISNAKVYHSLDGTNWSLVNVLTTYVGETEDDHNLESGDTSVMFTGLTKNSTYKIKIVGTNNFNGQEVVTPEVEFKTLEN